MQKCPLNPVESIILFRLKIETVNLKKHTMKKLIFLYVIFTFLYLSCINKKTKIPATAFASTVEPIDSSAEKIATDPSLCDEISDMDQAMPKMTAYNEYQLLTRSCNNNDAFRAIQIKFYKGNQLFCVTLTEGFTDVGFAFKERVEKTYETAVNEPVENAISTIKVSSLNIGEKGSLMTMCMDSEITAKFQCILKQKYALEIVTGGNKDFCKPAGIESFLKDYIAKIDISKLK